MMILHTRRKNSPLNDIRLLEEPLLSFASGQTMQYPRTGLVLHGPVEAPRKSCLSIGYIGPEEGLEHAERFLARFMDPLRFPMNPKARVPFPGFEAAYGCALPPRFAAIKKLDLETIRKTLMVRERKQRIFKTVELYVVPLERSRREDEAEVDLWLAYIPDAIYTHCRPKSHPLTDPSLEAIPSLSVAELERRLKSVEAGQQNLFEDDEDREDDLEAVEYKEDFRDQLKRRLLNPQIPVQLVRQNTMAILNNLEQAWAEAAGKERTQSALYTHANDILWNLSTTLFYKSCGSPWKLASLRPGVCYVGLVFKRTGQDYGRRRGMNPSTAGSRTACCAAQMFLDSGDGTVFKGAVGPWFSPETKECHLDRSAAERLIRMAVDGYRSRFDGESPKELFIHGKAAFNDEEWGGFCAAVPPETQLSGIRIRTRSQIRLYPRSDLAALRGVACILDDRHAVLFTNGWIPRMQTYPGREVPVPLTIDVVRGEPDIVTVLEDVLKLTKLNYNSCLYGDGIPVTLRFANSIGSVLTAGPDIETPPLPFKFYI